MSRRPHLLVLGVLACAALLTACGGGGSSGPGPASTSSSRTLAATTSASSSQTNATSTTGAATSAAGAATGTTTTHSGGRTSASTSASTSTSSSPSGSASPKPATPVQGIAAAVAVCRREVASATALTATEKAQLGYLCTVAGTGDRAAVRAAERKVCLTVIADSAPGLRGPAVSAARQSCNRL